MINDDERLLIWSEAGRLRARFVPYSLPVTFQLDSRLFAAVGEDAGWTDGLFWDAIRDDLGSLVGIRVLVIENPDILRSPFLARTDGVIFDNGMLDLFLCGGTPSQIECTQGFPVVIYQNQEDGDIIVGITRWGWWGRIAFELAQERCPIALERTNNSQ